MHERGVAGGAEDDAPEIQAAIDAAHEAGGGTVVLPAGTSTIAEAVVLRDNVTLRGVTVASSVLRRTAGSGPVVRAGEADGAASEGWTVTHLRLDGGGRATCGLEILGGARFGIVRRVWITDVAGDGLATAGGPLEHLCVEGLTVERCGASGLRLEATADSRGAFLSEVVVGEFGLRHAGDGTLGAVRLATRAIVSQLHVDAVPEGRIGVHLVAGSDHSTLTGVFVGTRGGTPVLVSDGVAVSMAPPSIRVLAAA